MFTCTWGRSLLPVLTRTLWQVPQRQDDFFFLLLGVSQRVVSGKGKGFVCLLSLVVPAQECPSGIVNEENFKQIYSQFFPQGGEESDTQGGDSCPSLG